VPQGNGIRRSKDLRARFRKFLILTNERKKMSKTTIRKRIAITATSALVAGLLSAVVSAPVASANHPAAGSANALATIGGQAGRTGDIGSLFVGTVSNTTGAATVSATAGPTAGVGISGNAKSLGLLAKDTSSGTAQTATVLGGGKLSLYSIVATAASFSASAGTFSDTMGGAAAATAATYASDLKSTWTSNITTATGVATIWTAPSTAGTYTVSLYTGFITSGTTMVAPSTTNGLGATLSGNITVTVVAASAGGAYSAAYSACNIAPAAAAITAGAGTAGIDNTVTFTNGDSAYINFDLNDAYNADLAAGNIVVTATNGALVNIGAGSSGAAAGTSSTDVDYIDGATDTVRIDQGTANAPVTTTVTVTYNGTTVCTKTITIRGAVAKLTVAHVGVQKTGNAATAGNAQWMYQNTGVWQTGALFSVVATDSAGNIVSTPSTNPIGTYSAVSSTLTTTVNSINMNLQSTTSSSSSTLRYNYGAWGCDSNNGQTNLKIKFTTTATGAVVESDAFVARCGGDVYTYTASLDKAAYNIGDIGTATVKFLDSKGVAANSVTSPGAGTWTLPFMTGVDFTLPTSSATAVTKADGTMSYTFTVGTSTTVTPGTYSGIVEYAGLVNSAKTVTTYKISTGGDQTSNADILKSIVALIASINKQIQALQKLILKR